MQTETYFTKLNAEEEEEGVLYGRLCITNRHWLLSDRRRRDEKVEFKVVCVKKQGLTIWISVAEF